MKIFFQSVFTLLLISNLCVAQSNENTSFIDTVGASIGDIKEELIQVGQDIYMIRPYGMAGNTGVYIGDHGVILVDDQWSMLADRIKELTASITDKKIKTIINTHYHFDHTHGNLAFSKEGIPIISQENALMRMSTRQVMPTFFNVVQEAYPESARPSMTFVEKFIIRDKDETIELIHLKNAHTDGDLIVYFKHSNVFHTGDIFITMGLPHIDEVAGGSIYGVIEAVDYLLKNSDDKTKFIPGHGPVSTRKDVKKYADLLKGLLMIVEELTHKNLGIDQIIEQVKQRMEYQHYSGDDFIRQVHRSVLRKSEK